MWWNWWLQWGNHCSVDNAIQQPSLDRQSNATYWRGLSVHKILTQTKKNRYRLRNRGALGRIFITYRSMTSGPLISLLRHGWGARDDLSRQRHVSVLESFFLFSKKHLTATWAQVAAPAVTSSNTAFAIRCTQFFRFSHSTTIISLHIAYQSVFFNEHGRRAMLITWWYK